MRQRMHKVTPRHKVSNFLNETSVEVLKLDASEFNISDREVTKSNLMTLKSEEFLPPTATMPKQLMEALAAKHKLNATF